MRNVRSGIKNFIKYVGWQIVLLMLVLMALYAIPETVFSQTNEVSATLIFRGKHEPVAGTKFNIYLISDTKTDEEWELNDEFEGSGALINFDTDEDTMGTAQLLEGFLLEEENLNEKINPYKAAFSDNMGRVQFNGLKSGVYLITGEEWSGGDYVYTPKPVIFEAEDGSDIEVESKYDTRNTASNDDISLEVVNIWQDDGDESKRPMSVTVSLYQDGKLYDQAILNKENNWRHTWNNLVKTARWQLSEGEVSGDYYTELTKENDEFVVTNVYSASFGAPHQVEDSVTATFGDEDTTQIWWPVPILVLAGLIIFGFGFRSYRRRPGRNEG
jgi:hypothetical protein